ncbi:MAG: CaiB/BaiF CoA-transferase family protein [Pseudomonadota bacterium]
MDTHEERSARTTPLPLEGIRVVEFSHMIMGPACGVVLADLGADVIKVEPAPDGDNTRRLTGSGAGFFPMFNRNKRSIAVNVKDEKGKALVRDLIKTADVLIENFRPGALDKLGLGYEAMRALNPRLVYYSAKGFLPGPYEDRTALDEVVQMMGGLAYMTGPTGQPLRTGASVNDIMGGMFGVIGILAALRERDVTGEGSQVTSALYENCVFLCGQHMVQYAVTGQAANPMPERLSAWAIYDVFDTADDGQVFVGVVSDTQWRIFCKSFGLQAFLDDPELRTNPQRCAARARFMPKVRILLGAMTLADVMAMCERLGLPFAPIRRPQDLFDDPHLTQSGGFGRVTPPGGAPTVAPKLPLMLDDWRPGVRRDIPKTGEHTSEVAASVGWDDAAIEALVKDGVLATPGEAEPVEPPQPAMSEGPRRSA